MSPVRRVHRAAYGIDYSAQEIPLGPLTVRIEMDNVVQKLGVVAETLGDNSEVMSELADRMVISVRENIVTGEFTPILPETVERRKYPFHPATGRGARGPVGGSRPLVASGDLVNGIEARSKNGYAAAQRGREQWYGFLHEGGIGRLDRRSFMGLTRGQADELVRIYDDWVTETVEQE